MTNKFIALFSNDRKLLLWGIVVLVAVLIAVMVCPSVECFFISLTGTSGKLELIQLIGWGISGVIAIFGVMGLLQRAAALDKQNEMTEKGHIQERFNKATEHLGHASMSVRIAAFNAFCHLVEIKPDWQKTIFDVLCAHLRQTTKNENYQKKEKVSDAKKTTEIKPTEEVQSLLKILFIDNLIFSDMVADLEGVHLQGANLQGANLQGANLQDAILKDANLESANLQGANLGWANLECAKLQEAKLEKAKLQDVNLTEAKLESAKLQGANLEWAKLEKAKLQGANLQGAKLQWAYLANSEIDKKTKMPDGWDSIVKINKDDKTGVLLVDDNGEVIERF